MANKFWLAVLILLSLLASPAIAGIARDITATQASEMIQKNPQVFLLDVRTPGEYRQVRLQGARLIPIDQLLQRLGELPKDRPIVVYCTVGARSSQVLKYLAGQGYPEVYNLYGGLSAWQLRGLPVLKGAP